MAKVDVKLPEDFLLKLSQLGNKTDEICEKALEAGGEVVLEKVKENLSAVIGSGTKYDSRSTGELEQALGLSSVKQDRDGNHKIANIIEYGKHGQPAKPFLKPARASSRKACISAMQRTLEQEVEKL